MTNKQIARVLRETGALIEVTGGNAFRARAYQGVSRTVERLEEDVASLVSDGTLTEISGIGEGMAVQIAEIVERGSFELRDTLVASIPDGLLDVLRVKGIGAKKARTLWKKLGITSLEELEEAATIGRIADLPGFGPRSQETILANVRLFRSFQSKRRYAEAKPLADQLCATIRQMEAVTDVSFTGAIRRKMEVVDSLEIVVGADDAEAACRALAAHFNVEPARESEQATTLSGTLPDGFPVVIFVVPASDFGSKLWRTTGSETHCRAFEDRFGAVKPSAEESSLFDAAGLPWIAPELREHQGEIDAALGNILPELIELSDVRGVLHNHSTYSDGAHSLRQMADAVRARGYEYFAICDHSRSLVVANGLSIERVQQQQEEIRALNAEYGADGGPPFRVFSGIESDILGDGSLDYPDDVLATFDLVVASVHSQFNMTVSEATERLIRAVRNPYTTILGHATGRLLLVRTGYEIDHEAIIDACAETGVSIELNANPRRLDMDWRWIRRAADRGVLISINPDAHSIDEIDYLEWGVAAARKGWLTARYCLNTRSLQEFESWLATRRSARVASPA